MELELANRDQAMSAKKSVMDVLSAHPDVRAQVGFGFVSPTSRHLNIRIYGDEAVLSKILPEAVDNVSIKLIDVTPK